MAGDGTTPRAGQTVTVSVTKGQARLEACGAASCSLKTDATGAVATAVTATAAGVVTVGAVSAAGGVTASFTAAAETISLVSAPAGVVTVGAVAATSFAVKVVGADGVSPIAGEAVVLTAMGGGIRFAACGGATCTVMTDTRGVAQSGVVATAAGAVTVSAACAGGAVTASFSAGVETIQVVGAPSGVVTVGVAAPTAFAVRLLAADGVSPVAGEAVRFRATVGGATLGACGAADCTVLTDARGLAATQVTPTTAGTVTVTASATAGSQAATVTGRALPATMQVTQAPTGTVFAGDALQPGLVVQLLLADGTPVAGQAVRFGVASGAASFAACGGSACTVLTNANGVAASGVRATAAGALTLTAMSEGVAGALLQTVAVVVGTRQRLVTLLQPVLYVAEGVSTTLTATVALSDNSATTDGVAVRWTGGAGMSVAAGTSTTSGGMATMSVAVRGLAAGVMAQGTACAWGVACGTVTAQGVSAAEWHMEVVSGAGQQVSATATLAPVTLRVADGAGHPVVGASVTLYQAVTAWQQACDATGRCPAPAVLKTVASQGMTDGEGLVRVVPAEITGEATTTQITVTTGTQGSVTVAVAKRP